MRIAALLVSLLLLTVLGGCLDPEDDGEGSSTTSTTGALITFSTSRSTTSGTTSSSSSTTSATTTSTGPVNRAPTGSLTVAMNATNATFDLAGSDPDGDTIVWDLEFGDGARSNGTTLPATVSHAYAVGNYTAKLTLTDGKAPTTYEAAVKAAAAAAAQAVTVTGATSGPGNPTTSALLGANGCLGFTIAMSGIDCVFGELAAGLEGKPFVFTSTAAAPDYELWDTCDAAMGTAVQAFGGPTTGTLPAGVGCVVMWNYGDGTGEFTFAVG